MSAVMLNSSQETINYQMRIPACLSIAGSLFIIISYAVLPNIRKYKYFEIVLYTSVNDLVASIGMAIGDIPSGSIACWIQGITTNYNFLASIAWTTVLSYELYLVIMYQEKIESYLLIHLFCWLFPLLPTFLPLSTNNYGKYDDEAGWCYLDNRPDTPSWSDQVWTIVGFYGWIWIAILLVTYMYSNVQIKLRKMNLLEPQNRIMLQAVHNLSYYPLLLIICWSFTSACGVYSAYIPSGRTALQSMAGGIIIDMLGTVLPASQGFLHFVIFVWRSPVVRKEWIALFGRKSQNSTEFDDNAVIAPFQISSSMFGATNSSIDIFGKPRSSKTTNSSRYLSQGSKNRASSGVSLQSQNRTSENDSYEFY